MPSQKVIKDKKLSLAGSSLRSIYRALSARLYSDNRLREIERGGIRYLVWSGEDIGKKLLILRKFEAAETKCFQREVRPGDICLDVGGNIGYYALNLAHACAGHGGRVYVFEPIPKNALIIKLSMLRNNIDNIEVIEMAVSNVNGSSCLETPEGDTGYAYLAPGAERLAPLATVATTRIDDFVRSRSIKRVDILKVDVEGAECLVLDGAKELLSSRDGRPRLVMAELVDEFLQRFSSSVEEVISYMNTFGYKPFSVTASGSLQPLREHERGAVFNVFFQCGAT